MMLDLWTPSNVLYLGSTWVGFNKVTGESILEHYFRSLSPVTGNNLPYITVLSMASESIALLEEQLGNAHEASIRQESEKPPLAVYTPEERKEQGKEIEDVRVTKLKMKESTNNKIGYRGI